MCTEASPLSFDTLATRARSGRGWFGMSIKLAPPKGTPSAPQRSARRLLHLLHQLLREALDRGVGQCRVLGLQRHFDGEGLLALGQALALVDVEEPHARDQLLVGVARGLEERLGGE